MEETKVSQRNNVLCHVLKNALVERFTLGERLERRRLEAVVQEAKKARQEERVAGRNPASAQLRLKRSKTYAPTRRLHV